MKCLTVGLSALLTALLAFPAATAPEPAPPQEKPAPENAPEKVWQAGLQRIAAKYRFLQVASPGGLWEKVTRDGKTERQQVSMSQLPKALREQLENAEIQILDLRMPTTIEASMEKSPGVGGMIRHYTEHGRGKLVMHGLPGIGMEQGDSGEYQGDAIFGIEHSSLTNPSVSGVWKTRLRMEPTWGVAALDFADLTAMKPLKEGEKEDDAQHPIFNARILRSGLEIFAFVQWTDPQAHREGFEREITGCVRLIRVDEAHADQ